ncbi:MAG: cytochrome c [Gammaproteobacteria bacterium]|nr:cytochrome c [Gammaproteobacteria bacterium]
MSRTRFFAALAAVTLSGAVVAGGDPAAGKEKSAVCAGCHGVDGNSVVGANPRLAGQYESYLYQALTQYKNGQRNDILMANIVRDLSDQDLKDLAAWFASQDGDVLQVLSED